MMYHTYIPRSVLSKFVAFFWSSEGDDLPQAQVRLLPIGAMEIVINLREDSIALYDSGNRTQCGSTRSSRLCGIHSKPVIIDHNSQVAVMGLHFKPGGGVPFFACPAIELHNQIVSLDEVWKGRAGELRERLIEAPTVEMRFLVLEHVLLNLMTHASERHPAVDFALHNFTQSLTPVGLVIDQIGFSARHFGRLFQDQVGLTPKLFCRIQRLRRALYLLVGKEHVDWMDVVLACGYFDQAHFIHDFHTFTGCTPTIYLNQRGLHPCHVVLPN